MADTHKNQDSPERYILRRKWYPYREHRGGVGGGDYDFMADELLYRPGRLGRATVKPSCICAGEENRALSITYIAGENGLKPGAEVSFLAKGTAPLGGAFQVQDSNKPCFVRFSAPKHCTIVPFDAGDWRSTFPIGFRVANGELKQGDGVNLEVSSESNFSWTRIAGRKEIKICVKPQVLGPEYRLPEPLIITIEPGPAERIEAIIPGSRLPGQQIEAVITTRDTYDNRVPANASVEIEGKKSVDISSGFSAVAIESPSNPLRISATLEQVGFSTISNPCIVSTDLQLYFGDLHAHDLLSEAEGYPEDVYLWAREDRRFDFLAVSPQSHGWHDNETWTVTKYMNERHHEPGRFVTFLSYEWQRSGYGDKIIHYLGGDQPCLYADDPRYNTPSKLYEALRCSDAFVISHHPAYPLDSWVPGTDYASVETDVERLIELWSMHGISEGYRSSGKHLKNFDPANTVTQALRRGLRFGFVGGSDTHKGRPGGSLEGQNPPYWGGMAAVWAQTLTRRDLFEAFVARRTYALTGARIVLRMLVNGAWMGSEIPFSEEVTIRIDCWSPGKIKKVELLRNTRLLRDFKNLDEECHIEYDDRITKPTFYHCRITLEDGNLAVGSPVWIG